MGTKVEETIKLKIHWNAMHYDGPDGDQNLGEIHQLFGGGDWINTRSSMVSVPFVDLGTVRWLKSYTMATDANRFLCGGQTG